MLTPGRRWLIASAVALAIVSTLGWSGLGAFLGFAGVVVGLELVGWPVMFSSWYAFWTRRGRTVCLYCGRLGKRQPATGDFVTVWRRNGVRWLCRGCASMTGGVEEL